MSLRLLPLLLLLFCISCDRRIDERAGSSRYQADHTQAEPFVLLSPKGDTIPTGKPIPVQGKRIDPDRIARPIIFQPRDNPLTVPAYTNARPAGTPKVGPILSEPTVITPGQDGVPLPKIVSANGIKRLASMSPPVPASDIENREVIQYDIKNVNIEQGLISSFVTSILEDSRGNLWFGSSANGGVSRYDGTSFAHFSPKEGFNSVNVTSMLEDGQGNLWFGTNQGLICYDGQYFTHFTIEQGLNHNTVWSILLDQQGNLWLGTIGGGVSRYDGQSFTHFTTENGLSHNIVRSMLEDKQGNLWFGTIGGLSRYTPKANNSQGSFTHFTTAQGLSENRIRAIYEDRQGDLWFGTLSGGVNRYDPEANNGQGSFTHFTTEEGLIDNRVQAILEDSQGNMWFGTYDAGVSRYDPNAYEGRGSFTDFATAEGLTTQAVFSIYEDSEGKLWFGTRGDGVIRYDGQSFTHITTRQGLNKNQIQSIMQDSRGTMWFGTYMGGANRYDGHGFSYFTNKHGVNGNIVRTMVEDRHGNLWFGANSGASYFSSGEPMTFTVFFRGQGLSHGTIHSMVEDRQGNMWFGTAGGGVNRYDGHIFTHFTTEQGLGQDMVWSIIEDRQGNMWFGTAGAGVICYDGRNFTHYTTNEGLSDNLVTSILEDSQGNMWFGTGDGVANRFDGHSFVHYPVKSRFTFNRILSIIEDSKKNIWIGSQKGGVMLLVPLSEGEPENDYKIFNFNQEDGLLNSEINCIYEDHDHRIWIGSSAGLNVLDLDQFDLPTAAPKSVQISHIGVDQQFVDYRRLIDTSYCNTFWFGTELRHSFDSVVRFHNYPATMTLPNNIDHLTFHFSAIDWAAHHKIRYSYWMEGVDKGWSDPQIENKAEYRDLKYGKYTFKLKAIGVAQTWSKPFEYSFTIRPPWWLTWWACAFYGLIMAGILHALYRFMLNRQLQLAETHRLRELDEVKTKLYTNITHEFRTPLTVIQGVTNRISSKSRDLGITSITEDTKIVKRNSAQLLSLVNQMLDLRKLESGNLPVHLIQGDIIIYLKYLLESFHSLAESKDIRLHFLAKEKEVIMDYDPEKIRHIMANLLSNAVKFTPEAGNVYVTVDGRRSTVDGSSLKISVKDNGMGIPADKLPHIFDRFYQVDDESTRQAEGTGIGLTLTKELVKLLEGEISVESEPGRGTTFEVSLPIRNTAPITEQVPEIDAPLSTEAVVAGTGSATEVVPAIVGTSELPLALIVEDNRDVADYIRSCLEGYYRVELAANGQEGIERAIESVPDLVISDVMMPEKDGFEVTQTLKNDPHTSHIPIILLTAKADIQSKLQGLERGADAYLPKPFNQQELLIRSRKLLELRTKLQTHYLAMAGGSTPAPSTPKSPEEKQEDAFLLRVREVVKAHLTDFDFSVEQLASEVSMSRSQLHRKLSALTGYSASRFIRYIRLSKAKEMLRDLDLPIGNVAYDSGFSDPVYFTRVFRQEFGRTPTEWREND